MSQLHGALLRLNNELRTNQLALTNAIDAMAMGQGALALAKVLKAGFDLADIIKQLNPTAYETVIDEIVLSYERAGLKAPAHDNGQPPAGSVPVGKVNTEPPARAKK